MRLASPLLCLGLLGLLANGGCGSSSPTPPTPPDDGSCTMQQAVVANEGWAHVPEGSAVTYAHNPPASGPHYPVWLRYEEFTSAQPRGYWVHNLEHGAIVMLYRPDAGALIGQMQAVYRALPNDPVCGNTTRAVLTPDPQLITPVAVVAADNVLVGTCVSSNAINSFVTARRGRGPEQVCDNGTRP